VQPSSGTLLIVAAGHSADSIAGAQLRIQGPAGWSAVGTVSGSVPAAPDERELLAVPVPAGTYTGISLGDDVARVDIDVAAGQVEPVLIGIEGGRLIAGAAYAGNDQLNLGLGELAGKFVAMPAFALQDQDGKPFDNVSAAGEDLVIAAFHTTCHQTCPLYTALFFQLQRGLPGGVRLVEVTTDPGTDTPAALHAYAQSIGAGWTFATGSADALTAFWKPFGVALATGDSHVATLALVDRHGYVRLVYRGVPAVGHDLPPQLVSSLGAEGLHELASGGDGWGSAEVLKALLTITGPIAPATQTGARAPAFALMATDSGRVSLGSLAGKPLVINFWASYCPPCRAEMPMLVRDVGAAPSARLVLIDEGDSADAARGFLNALGITQPSLLDPDLSAGHAYGAIAYPTTVFVKPDGTIAARQVGQLDEGVLTAELATLGD
jgi:cytochrome oxidase Cu insertion factor (SCO1/SenC/PrrC family)/thiol-disulfide isomerase/thioredoxin